ncbi:hypothetical protein BT69DRAFT_451361 [Atractiella rhizophila]|nr:hypothetical protein BT69DRAFT_451361 [Atractiella rhizophila]
MHRSASRTSSQQSFHSSRSSHQQRSIADDRRSITTQEARLTKVQEDYSRHYVPSPSLVRLLRLFLFLLTSLAAIATAILALQVVVWYNSHTPSIAPSWGSCIALIVVGFLTPVVFAAQYLVIPRIVRRGSVADAFFGQVRSELFLLFAFAVIWCGCALAMAVDLGGYENCIWDGYYHWPRPSSFGDVCRYINVTIPVAWVAFGFSALQMSTITALAVYTFLYLDQDVLSEPSYDMCGRAYRAQRIARASVAQYDEKQPSFVGSPENPFDPRPLDESPSPQPGEERARGGWASNFRRMLNPYSNKDTSRQMANAPRRKASVGPEPALTGLPAPRHARRASRQGSRSAFPPPPTVASGTPTASIASRSKPARMMSGPRDTLVEDTAAHGEFEGMRDSFVENDLEKGTAEKVGYAAGSPKDKRGGKELEEVEEAKEENETGYYENGRNPFGDY